VVSLSGGSAVRRIQRLGLPVHVLDEPDDAIAVGALATFLADAGAEVVHNHTVPGGAGGDACRDRTRRGGAPAALRDRHGAFQPDPQRGGPRRSSAVSPRGWTTWSR